MAVAFDPTVGGAAATSYVTVEQAEALLGALPGGERWTTLGESDKQLRLVQATALLDLLPYRGIRATPTQALAFPRTGLPATERDPAPDGIIPGRVRLATAIFALLLAINDPSVAPFVAGAAVGGAGSLAGFKSITLGPIKLDVDTGAEAPAPTSPTFDPGNPLAAFPGVVRVHLTPYLLALPSAAGALVDDSGSGQIRAVRTS